MILLGLILIALGAALGVLTYLAAAGESQTVALAAWGWTRSFTALELLAVGAAVLLLIWLGWAAMSASMRRRSRLRREEREQERYAELERTHNAYRDEQERRFSEARLRDEDFARREEQIRNRQAEIELREDELGRREAMRRDTEGPSVADVVTGRAEGRVSDGTAEWVDDRTNRPVGEPGYTSDEARAVPEYGDTRELRVDEHGRPAEETDVPGQPLSAPRRTDDV